MAWTKGSSCHTARSARGGVDAIAAPVFDKQSLSLTRACKLETAMWCVSRSASQLSVQPSASDLAPPLRCHSRCPSLSFSSPPPHGPTLSPAGGALRFSHDPSPPHQDRQEPCFDVVDFSSSISSGFAPHFFHVCHASSPAARDQELLRLRADMTLITHSGRTPLQIAQASGSPALRQLLDRAEADRVADLGDESET